jgi:hypothetical protein
MQFAFAVVADSAAGSVRGHFANVVTISESEFPFSLGEIGDPLQGIDLKTLRINTSGGGSEAFRQ